jgi:hypothetical protein
VAFVHAGTAYLLASPFRDPPRPLGLADGLFPMVWPGLVGAQRAVGSGVFEAWYVDAQDGNRPDSTGWQLPAGYRPVGQFLALGPGSVLRSWQPGQSGQVRLGRTIGYATTVVGDNGSTAAWLAGDNCAANRECPFHLTDTAESASAGDRIIPAPADHYGYLPGGALSPDAGLIAAFVAGPGGRRDQAQLVIINTASSQVSVIPHSTISIGNGEGSAQWTPDGSYVLFSGPSGSMRAYGPGNPRATTLGIDGSTSFTVE